MVRDGESQVRSVHRIIKCQGRKDMGVASSRAFFFFFFAGERTEIHAGYDF